MRATLAKAAATAIPDPVGVVVVPKEEAWIALLQAIPVPLVYERALEAPEQLGIANATGLAVEPVKFATTVSAASVAKYGSVTEPFESVNVPEDERLVNEPVPGVPEPIGPGAANVVPPNVAAFTLELQPNPVPEV